MHGKTGAAQVWPQLAYEERVRLLEEAAFPTDWASLGFADLVRETTAPQHLGQLRRLIGAVYAYPKSEMRRAYYRSARDAATQIHVYENGGKAGVMA